MQSHMKKKKQQNPSWQELNSFILSKIFSCLSLHDQLFGLPYVCHSWLSATLDTLFHNSKLDHRPIDDLHEEKQRLRYTHLLKLAMNHYHGWVSIYFPRKHTFGYFATIYIAENTPDVSCVALPSNACVNIVPVFVSLPYWKNLRVFHARINPTVGFQLLSQLVDFCKNVVELGFHGELMEKEASCIVGGFPRLEKLDLSESTLSTNALATVLGGKLKCMKELNILHCLFLGGDGKDLREDYTKMKAFKNEMLEKVAAHKSLKKFLHCL